MRDLLLIATGGALGALARHGVNLATARWLPTGFPYGTLVVNVVGCFIIGVVAQTLAVMAAESQPGAVTAADGPLRPVLHYGIAVGFLGALTTFSSLGLETVRLGEAGQLPLACGNVIAHVALGLLAVAAGISLVRAFS